MDIQKRKVAIIGLGYVGLPVAIAFGKVKKTIGFDINRRRIEELAKGFDRTNEVKAEELAQADVLFTSNLEDLAQANFYIVAVPTPIDEANKPDIRDVLAASRTVGKVLKTGDIVVYESTVYPGLTEEECVPVLEEASGLQHGSDFKVGYSPERINPGDTEHRFATIRKVVAGHDAQALEIIAQEYEQVVTAGVYRASSIKVAEAAKVIENTQRDLNIALMNELALIFDRLDIDTHEVLEAAGTKWNFLPFRPGLVGGHCIGVDPYYLTHRAEKSGYIPQVILAGRRINDEMGTYVAHRTIKEMIRAGHPVHGNTVTVLGLTFKENCPDIRNSKSIDIIRELQDYGVQVQVSDALADPADVRKAFHLEMTALDDLKPAAAVVIAVAHDQYRRLGIGRIAEMMKANPVLIDVKGICRSDELDTHGIHGYRL